MKKKDQAGWNDHIQGVIDGTEDPIGLTLAIFKGDLRRAVTAAQELDVSIDGLDWLMRRISQIVPGTVVNKWRRTR